MVHKPIVFGTFAIFRGKKVASTEAYAWCVYTRGARGEDISKFVRKVVFELDPSFPEPVRTVDKPPFEIHEVGWGQFAIGIKVYFHDMNLRPVEVLKDLILFDDSQPSPKRSIVNEDYNELVFVEPSASMLAILNNPQPLVLNIAEPVAEESEKKEEVDNNASASVEPKPEEEKKEEVPADDGVQKYDIDGHPITKISKFHWMEKTKAYDRAGIERGYKDKDFGQRENQDLD